MKNKFNFFDMHTHSENSHDSVLKVEDMKKKMENKNVMGFAVTDHCDVEYYETIDLKKVARGTFDDVEKEKTNKLKILKGIEVGEGFWHPEVTKKILNNFDFDVVIGSVHAVKLKDYEMPYSQIDFEKMGKEKAEKYMDKYFDDMLFMIENCDFDVLGHLTCPLRYMNGKYNLKIDVFNYIDKIKIILGKIKEKNIALEVNTSCVFEGSGYNEFLPNKEIIKMYKEMGGKLITTGSDAHIKENGVNKFEELYEFLKEIGFNEVYYYEKRKALPIKI